MFNIFKNPTASKRTLHQLVDKDTNKNIILTDSVRLSLDTAQTGKNLNVCLIGGAGAGKTQNYILPNILQANTSYIITDRGGYLLKETGEFLQKQGYVIKVLNLNDIEHSNRYNPFNYIYDKDGNCDESAVIKMAMQLLEGDKNNANYNAMHVLVSALCLYLIEFESKEKRNLENLIKLLFMPILELDKLFSALEKENKYLCQKRYMLFKGIGRLDAEATRIAAHEKLKMFYNPHILDVTNCDDMEIEFIGERKTAIFITLPATNYSISSLANMLIVQIFYTLFIKTESLPNNKLTVPVRFMLDEFANGIYVHDLEKYLAVCGSHNISVNISLQSIEQLKALYKYWDLILNNSDSILFFGSHSVETLKWFSEFICNQISIDKLKALDTDKCVVNIRGVPAFYDKKFNAEERGSLI